MKYISDEIISRAIGSSSISDIVMAREAFEELEVLERYTPKTRNLLETIFAHIAAQNAPSEAKETAFSSHDIPAHLFSAPAGYEIDPDSAALYNEAMEICRSQKWDPRNRSEFIDAVRLAEQRRA